MNIFKCNEIVIFILLFTINFNIIYNNEDYKTDIDIDYSLTFIFHRNKYFFLFLT